MIAFGGSFGGAALTVLLPLTVYFLTLAVDKVGFTGGWEYYETVDSVYQLI